MVALSILFAQGIFEHFFVMQSIGMDPGIVEQILAGDEEDVLGLWWKYQGMVGTWWGGVICLWIAAGLTLMTGWDYFQKALPFLKDEAKP